MAAPVLALKKSTVLEAVPRRRGREAEVVAATIIDRAVTAMIGREEIIITIGTVPGMTNIGAEEMTTVIARTTTDAKMTVAVVLRLLLARLAAGTMDQAAEVEAVDATDRLLAAIVVLPHHKEEETIGIGTVMEEEMIDTAEITETGADAN